MIEILSLPRRHNINVVKVKNVVFKSGLPINSLPGWESIPLNSKLPMLKCPDNQVIFSKNKIGQSFKHLKQEFDPCGRDSFPEYNPLHDSNLKTFYANERNLKRLRENGEITQSNDVICNLKDFNEYRLQLHKSQLYYILQELNRHEAEQRDRMLIANAEAITSRDHRNLSARQHSYHEILQRKKRLDTQRSLRYQKLWQKTEEKFQRITGLTEMRMALLEHKKILNQLKLQHHWDACNDIQRKQLISLKKLFQFKKERLQKNMRLLKEAKSNKATEASITSWRNRLNERISNQDKMRALLEEVATKRKVFIENHRLKYKEKWAKIQEEIKQKAKSRKQIKKRRSSKRKKSKKPSEEISTAAQATNYEDIFNSLLGTDLCEALKAAVDLENGASIPFDIDDPIYKAAKFIINNIINNYDKDLSGDRITFDLVAGRVNSFFDEAQSFVTYRATHIIASAREAMQNLGNRSVGSLINRKRSSLFSKCVSFSKFSDTIGTSSYDINPMIDLKEVADRTPTPAGSLASIVFKSQENILHETQGSHIERNDMIFIEHHIIKFKRELIVGMGRRVFAAIQCHFDNKIMDVRKELLELDRQFLVAQMTKSILSYSSNSLNFESCIKLCISSLASDIIWSLQKQLLRPKRDPRGIVQPQQCCTRDADRINLCLYCD